MITDKDINTKIHSNIMVRKESFGYLIYDAKIDKFYFLHKKDLENVLDINQGIQRIIDYLIKYNIECKKYDFEKSNLYLKKPCTVTWEITNKCNLDCCYCFSKNSSSIESNYELANHIIDNIKNAEVMRVIVTGGEPLINLEGLFYILKNLSNNKLGLVLSTNGTLIDRDIAIEISKYVTTVQISLDGTRETHDNIKGRDAFDKTIEGINYCIENGIFTQVNLIPTKLNKKDLIETISLCEELGVRQFHLFPLVNRGKCSKVYETLKLSTMEIENIYSNCQETKKKKGWNISISLSRRHLSQGSCILIKPNGLVQSPSYDSNESFEVGELKDNSLLKIWDESEIFSKKNHLIQTNPYLIIK